MMDARIKFGHDHSEKYPAPRHPTSIVTTAAPTSVAFEIKNTASR
jgi:hypothetical protein